MPANPKYLAKLAEEQKVAVEATVEGLAEVKKTLERLEKKVDALARMVKTLKE